MKLEQAIDERLWDYIDGISSAEEKTIIENLLQEDEDWKQAYLELTEIHRSLHSSGMEQPSLRFTKNVMDQISVFKAAPFIEKYINKKFIWLIAGFVVVLITGLLTYAFAQVNWTSGQSQFNLDTLKIDVSIFSNSTFMYFFMMINVVLALMFLDRFMAGQKSPST